MPGVPRELTAMFEQSFAPTFLAGSARHDLTVEVVTHGEEARLWGLMQRVEREFADVKIGSYPQEDRGIVLRLKGPPGRVEAAAALVRSALEKN